MARRAFFSFEYNHDVFRSMGCGIVGLHRTEKQLVL